MNHQDARRVLDEVEVLRNRSDLDLLIFFARHPRTLLTSEQLATFLGYELAHIAASLDLLLEAQLLTRTQNRNHAARLYVFAGDAASGGWVPSLLQLASTREGRLALLEALSESRSDDSPDSQARIAGARLPSRRPRPVLISNPRRGQDAASRQ